MRHPKLVAGVSISLSELLKTGAIPKTVLHGLVHSPRPRPNGQEEAMQERLKPWFGCGLTVDIVNAAHPWICGVSEKEGCMMIGVHYSSQWISSNKELSRLSIKAI